MSIRAVVRNGRLVVDLPTELPEGTVLELVLDDGGDQLDETQRAALHSAISPSLEDEAAGRTSPAEEILTTLRTRSGG